MVSDLPTIEYVGADGVRRELDFQRAPHPRFTVVVDRVEDDYVELTVTRGNSHPRVPTIGGEVVSTVETLTRDDRWTLQADTPSARPVGDTEAAGD